MDPAGSGRNQFIQLNKNEELFSFWALGCRANSIQFNWKNNIIFFWLGLRESAPGKATGNGAGNEPRNEPRKGTKTKPFRGAGKLRKPLFSLCFAQNWPPKGEPKMNPKWSPKWPLKWTGFGSLKGWTAIRKKINANSHGSDNYFLLGPRTNSIK